VGIFTLGIEVFLLFDLAVGACIVGTVGAYLGVESFLFLEELRLFMLCCVKFCLSLVHLLCTQFFELLVFFHCCGQVSLLSINTILHHLILSFLDVDLILQCGLVLGQGVLLIVKLVF